jgi:DNA-binding CsgD family transcriptional regulator
LTSFASNVPSTTFVAERLPARLPIQAGDRRVFDSSPTATIGRPSVVLVADPERAVTGYLRPALVGLAGCRIIEAGSLSAVNDVIDSGLRGDLAMVSVRFRRNTAAVIRALREAGWPRVIALVPPSVKVAVVMELVEAGASGVVSTPGVDVSAPDDTLPVHSLTTRELDVVRLVAEGMSNREIAEKLELSPLTVKSHLGRIARKLGVGDRAHIVALACRGQVIGPPGPT